MDKRVIKSKTALRKAFLAILAKEPTKKPQVKDVCDLANVNKTTFYRHYEDIEALKDDTISRVASLIIGDKSQLKSSAPHSHDLIEWASARSRLYADYVYALAPLRVELDSALEHKTSTLVRDLYPGFYNETQLKFVVTGVLSVISHPESVNDQSVKDVCELIDLIVDHIYEKRGEVRGN